MVSEASSHRSPSVCYDRLGISPPNSMTPRSVCGSQALFSWLIQTHKTVHVLLCRHNTCRIPQVTRYNDCASHREALYVGPGEKRLRVIPSRGPHRQETTSGTVIQILALLFLMETRPAFRAVLCEVQRLCGQGLQPLCQPLYENRIDSLRGNVFVLLFSCRTAISLL